MEGRSKIMRTLKFISEKKRIKITQFCKLFID